MRRTALIALLLFGAASAVAAQQWLHVSFGDDPVTRELSAPLPRVRVEPPQVPPPMPATAGGAEAERAVQHLDAVFESARQKTLAPPSLWPDVNYRFFNPAFDPFGYRGIPYPASPRYGQPPGPVPRFGFQDLGPGT